MPNPVIGPAYFRRYLQTPTRFRFQLRGHFFPLDGRIEAVSGPNVLVVGPHGQKWVNVSKSPKGEVVSVDELGAV